MFQAEDKVSIYGYIGTPDGNNDDALTQKYTILSFAASASMAPVHFCVESIKQQPNGIKPILAGMIANLQRGDVLVVSHYRNLANSTSEVLEVMLELSRSGVKLFVVTSDFQLDNNFQAQVVACATALLSQIGKELADTKANEQKPSEGKTTGRPVGSIGKSKLDGREEQIRSLLAAGVSMSGIARELDASRPTLLEFIKSRHLSV
jgi:DNA invertase Pin-like site-specific DNA recombinase